MSLLSLSVQVEISRHFNRRRQGPGPPSAGGSEDEGMTSVFVPLDWNGKKKEEEEEKEPVGFCCHHRQSRSDKVKWGLEELFLQVRHMVYQHKLCHLGSQNLTYFDIFKTLLKFGQPSDRPSGQETEFS